jgi:transcriptional regulator with XRE-family HTH domain
MHENRNNSVINNDLPNSKKLGEKIRGLRITEKMSQEELAFRINVSQSVLSRAERGASKKGVEKMVLNKIKTLKQFQKYFI